MKKISQSILDYNDKLSEADKTICHLLAVEITKKMAYAENKIWHSHPVWFLNENPIVGYSKEKKGLRLMFWSGADFGERALNMRGAKFKDASIYYTAADEINIDDLKRWMGKAIEIQWDYKNIAKRQGVLERLL